MKYNVEQFKVVHCLKSSKLHNSPVASLLKLNDKLLISGSADKSLKKWNLVTLECFETIIESHNSWVWSIIKLNEHQIAITGDENIRIWDLF